MTPAADGGGFTLRLAICVLIVTPCYVWQACLGRVTGVYLVDVVVTVVTPNVLAGYMVHRWVPKGWVRAGLVVVVGGEKKEKEGEIMDLREVIEGDSSSEEGEEDEGVGLLKKI